jgi:hypothetical protein
MHLPPLPDDDLGLLDLQAWVASFGGFNNIPAEAWAQWDRLYDAYHGVKKLDGRETRVP